MIRDCISFLAALGLFLGVAAYAGSTQGAEYSRFDTAPLRFGETAKLTGFKKYFVEHTPRRLALRGPTDGNLIGFLKQTDALIIQFGGGGNLGGMKDTLAYLKANPEKVVLIDGPCFSACTLLLEAKNTLWTNDAKFYFHSATAHWCADGKEQSGMSTSANEAMLDIFRPHTQVWIIESGAFESLEFTKMPEVLVERIYGSKRLDSRYAAPKMDEKKAKKVVQKITGLKTCKNTKLSQN